MPSLLQPGGDTITIQGKRSIFGWSNTGRDVDRRLNLINNAPRRFTDPQHHHRRHRPPAELLVSQSPETTIRATLGINGNRISTGGNVKSLTSGAAWSAVRHNLTYD